MTATAATGTRQTVEVNGATISYLRAGTGAPMLFLHGAGGVDGFIGDGSIWAASERLIELFYSANLVGAIWLSADYQIVIHPAYNAARGPVSIFGLRLHAEL